MNYSEDQQNCRTVSSVGSAWITILGEPELESLRRNLARFVRYVPTLLSAGTNTIFVSRGIIFYLEPLRWKAVN